MTQPATSRAGGRDSLAVPATVIVAVWSLGGLVDAADWLARPVLTSHGFGMLPAMSFVFFMVLVVTANVALAGLILAVIAAARTRPRRVLRAVAVAVVIAGGVTLQWWITFGSHAGDAFQVPPHSEGDQLATATAVTALVVLVATAVLLRVIRWPRRR